MIASLPMYWRAETAGLWRAFWAYVQDAGQANAVALPDLTAPEDLPADWTEHWCAPDLALSMTCSLPLRTTLRDRVTYVGTLGFGLPEAAGHYYSRIVMNRATWEMRRRRARALDDPPLRLAYNMAHSQSGWAVAHRPPSGQTRALSVTPVLETGSHRASVAAVAEGRADVAFVDAVTWRLIRHHDGPDDRLHLWGRSPSSPGLPLICARGRDPAPLRDALLSAVLQFRPEACVETPGADHWSMGGPLSFHVLPQEAYLSQPLPPAPPAGQP